jgi:hypothetical protein
MAYYTVDRFADAAWVVLEDDTDRTFSIPKSWVPEDTKEGDVLSLVVDRDRSPSAAVLNVAIDGEATERRRREVDELRQRLPRAPKGDFSL